MGLHAEEDEVGCGTGQAALQVGTAPNLLSLRVEAVEGLHSLLKELPLDLEGGRDREPGRGQPPWSVNGHLVGVGVGGSGRTTPGVGAAHSKTREAAGAHGEEGTLDRESGDLGFTSVHQQAL